MDAPRHDTTPQLIAMAEDAEVWQIEVNALIINKDLSLRSRIAVSLERNRDKR